MRMLLTLSALGLATVANAWTPDTGCKKFSEIYTDGQHLLELMWNGAFTYTTDEAEGYNMWWTAHSADLVVPPLYNPNDLITQAHPTKTVPTTCDLEYSSHEAPTPEGPDFTECHPWHANSCCHVAKMVTPEAINKAYGVGYEWDRCGPLSQACERFFVEEACLYECDVNVGLFRKYTDAQHDACSAEGVADGATVQVDGEAYNCTPGAWGGNDENKWQIVGMPIKASYADAWYRACANDLFIGGTDDCNGDMFACAGSYHAQLADEAVLAAELAANETKAAEALEAQLAADLKAEQDKKDLPDWAIALIIILGLLGAPPPWSHIARPVHRSAWRRRPTSSHHYSVLPRFYTNLVTRRCERVAQPPSCAAV